MAISNRKKRAFTLYTVVMLLMFGVMGLFIVKKFRSIDVQYLGNYTLSMFVPDSIMGYVASENSVISSTKVVERDTIYSVTYTIDSNGLRVTPIKPDADRHFIFFGCSFTFGEGVDDEGSLPTQFANYLPSGNSTQVYNMALQGYGPQNMLRMLSTNRVRNIVKQPIGNAVYLLLPEHIYRAKGAPFVMYSWGASMPCYEIEGDGLSYKGSFADVRPLSNVWYKMLGFAGLLQVPSIGYPTITNADIALTAAIIDSSKGAYVSQYPGSKFSVVCYPSSWLNSEYQKLTKELTNRNIDLIDLRGLFSMDSTFSIVGDGHPNRLANGAVAGAIKDRTIP